jgi:hypothetical protein
MLAVTTLAACQAGQGNAVAYIIPGPTGPTPVATITPYVWDTRDELAVWLDSKVSRGPISLSGEGRDAVIRIETNFASVRLEGGASVQWVLRGPDFDTPVTGVRAVRIIYTWLPALPNTSVPAATPDVTAAFEVPGALPGPDQRIFRSSIVREPSGEMILSDRYVNPFDVRYLYLYSDGGNRGVLEIDSIALIRD